MMRWLIDRLLYGGTTKLTHFERSLFEIACSSLPSAESSALRNQVQHLRLIQKWINNKKIEYHLLESGKSFPLPNHPAGKEVTFLKFQYLLDGARYSSNLITWEGIIIRIETPKGMPKPLLKKAARNCTCTLTKTIEKTLAEEMDEEEHGPNLH